jgi:hypothetical protein
MSTKTPLNPKLVDFKGDLLTIIAEGPLPPGSRVAFSLEIPGEAPAVSVQGKVVSATRLPGDGAQYRMPIRIHSLLKETREALAAALSLSHC